MDEKTKRNEIPDKRDLSQGELGTQADRLSVRQTLVCRCSSR